MVVEDEVAQGLYPDRTKRKRNRRCYPYGAGAAGV